MNPPTAQPPDFPLTEEEMQECWNALCIPTPLKSGLRAAISHAFKLREKVPFEITSMQAEIRQLRADLEQADRSREERAQQAEALKSRVAVLTVELETRTSERDEAKAELARIMALAGTGDIVDARRIDAWGGSNFDLLNEINARHREAVAAKTAELQKELAAFAPKPTAPPSVPSVEDCIAIHDKTYDNTAGTSNECLRAAIEAVRNAILSSIRSEWRSVSEPPTKEDGGKREEVLWLYPNGQVIALPYDCPAADAPDGATHWMPVPSAPPLPTSQPEVQPAEKAPTPPLAEYRDLLPREDVEHRDEVQRDDKSWMPIIRPLSKEQIAGRSYRTRRPLPTPEPPEGYRMATGEEHQKLPDGALYLASGEWILSGNTGDWAAPNTLYCVPIRIQPEPGVEFVPLEACDIPPGTVFRDLGEQPDVAFWSPRMVASNGVTLRKDELDWRYLFNGPTMEMKRPGENWQPCRKEKK